MGIGFSNGYLMGINPLELAYCLPPCGRPILSIRKIDKVLSRFEGKIDTWQPGFGDKKCWFN